MPHHLLLQRISAHQGPLRHQARLVVAMLLLMALYFAVIGTLNLLLFAEPTLATMDFIGMVLVLGTLFYFARGGPLLATSWLVVALLTVIILLFIHLADGRAYSLIWITLLPPISFFLLGRRAGAWICGLAFVYIALFVYLRMPHWEPQQASMASFLNIVEVLIAHWFLFRLYEGSRAEAFAELERLSETDKLTGLHNRSRLDTLLAQAVEQHHRNQQPLTLILCDIDHFKRINDAYGHLTGDQVLKAVAEVLRSQTRKSDVCGRWGGEEFLIICPETDLSAAGIVVNKLQSALHTAIGDQEILVTLSFGLARLQPEERPEQLLRRADDALYAAKHNGRNQAIIAETEMTQPTRKH